MFVKIIMLSVFFVALALAGLGISVLLKKRGRFPETHISNNREMQKRGIGCSCDIDIGCCASGSVPGCSSCGSG
jgi:hypothetical protein